MKTKQDNNVSDRIGQVYAKTKIGMNLSNLVWYGIKIKQDNDVTNCIDAVYAKNKTKLPDRSNWVLFVTKTRQDNEVIDLLSLVYAETKTELSIPFLLGAIYDENQI